MHRIDHPHHPISQTTALFPSSQYFSSPPLVPLIPNCLLQLYRFLLLIGNQFCIGRVQFQEFVDILQSGLRDRYGDVKL